MYLTPIDYKTLLREDVREMIEGVDTSRLPEAEAAAAGYIRHTWNRRYAVDEILIPCEEHVAGQLYAAGDLVYWGPDPEEGEDKEYKVYTALVETNATPTAATDANWKIEDPRDKYVLELLVSLTVFNFFKSEATHALPEIVQKLRDEARKDVMMIGKGETLADLPKREDEDESTTGDIRWKSQTKEDNRW